MNLPETQYGKPIYTEQVTNSVPYYLVLTKQIRGGFHMAERTWADNELSPVVLASANDIYPTDVNYEWYIFHSELPVAWDHPAVFAEYLKRQSGLDPASYRSRLRSVIEQHLPGFLARYYAQFAELEGGER